MDQDQGPKESQPEASTSDTDPLVGFTIEDIKSVLGQVTDDILISIQVLILDSTLTYFVTGYLANLNLSVCKYYLHSASSLTPV